MRYYPVLLDLHGARCCVIGGGAVAERKVKALLGAGARVTVVSPAFTPGLARLAKGKKISAVRRRYRCGMARGFRVVVAATDDEAVNHAAAREAAAAGSQVNVVDDPAASTFIVPSVIDKGGLLISISTSGMAPCLSRQIRLELEKRFVPAYVRRLRAAAVMRRRLREEEPDIDERKRRMARFLKGGCRP